MLPGKRPRRPARAAGLPGHGRDDDAGPGSCEHRRAEHATVAGAGPGDVLWIVAGQSLAFGPALVQGGSLGDGYGRKRSSSSAWPSSSSSRGGGRDRRRGRRSDHRAAGARSRCGARRRPGDRHPPGHFPRPGPGSSAGPVLGDGRRGHCPGVTTRRRARRGSRPPTGLVLRPVGQRAGGDAHKVTCSRAPLVAPPAATRHHPNNDRKHDDFAIPLVHPQHRPAGTPW